MAEVQDRPQRRELRVVARRQAGGTGDERRRIFQRHLWLFLAVNGAVFALDYMTAPGIQFWHWLGVLWGIPFVVHLGGLLSRGFTPGELFIPPRSLPPIHEDAPPLEYELVKARQLRDGVTRAASAVRELEPELVDAAVAVAEEMEATVARLVAAARSGAAPDEGETSSVEGDLREALDRLDALHAGLIRAAVGAAPLDDSLPVDAAREHRSRLEDILARLEEGPGS